MKGLALLLLLPAAVWGQQNNCAKTETITKALNEQYGESVTVYAVVAGSDKSILFSVWTNPNTGTGTVIKTNIQGGYSCVLDLIEDTKIIANTEGKPT